MKVSFEGIGERIISFYNNSGLPARVGAPVKLSGNGEVSACADGDRLVGVAIACDEDFAAVQTGGFVLLPYSGTAPAVGFGLLAADGVGGIKSVSSGGGEFLLVEVDEANKTVGFML